MAAPGCPGSRGAGRTSPRDLPADWLLEMYPGVLVSKPMPHPDALYASDVCTSTWM